MEILIKNYLKKNNKTAISKIDYSLVNLSDGKGDFINFWNESKIGLPKPIFTEQEIKSIPFLEKKAQKLQELEDYYNSTECWIYKVKSTALKASITKEQDWFAKMLPAINGSFYLFSDDGLPILVTLNQTQAKVLNEKILIKMGFEINSKKRECEKLIKDATTIKQLDEIDIKKFLGEVPREVDIDLLPIAQVITHT